MVIPYLLPDSDFCALMHRNLVTAVFVITKIKQRTFRDNGILLPADKIWSNAQDYISQNTARLAEIGVHAYVTGIEVSGGENMVRVSVSADLSILFPSVVPRVVVTQFGVAILRALTY